MPIDAATPWKDRVSGLGQQVDAVVSAHDLDAPKEDQAFWRALARCQPFDPARTLLVDDNEQVLDSAARFGIAHLHTIRQPDLAKPPRQDLRYQAVDHLTDLLPTTATSGAS